MSESAEAGRVEATLDRCEQAQVLERAARENDGSRRARCDAEPDGRVRDALVKSRRDLRRRSSCDEVLMGDRDQVGAMHHAVIDTAGIRGGQGIAGQKLELDGCLTLVADALTQTEH